MKQVITTEKYPIKIWADELEDGALEQAKNLANLPFIFKHIAIMPDGHKGYGMPIGGVMATKRQIIPNAVGYDIGCGMIAVKLSLKSLDISTLKVIMNEVRKVVPVGFLHHKDEQYWSGFNNAPDIPIVQKELGLAKRSLGTLGGGNHFIEFQLGNDGNIWIMIHSGSRGFGYKIASEYNKKAVKICSNFASSVPEDLSFFPIDSDIGQEYFKAMNYALSFAFANRKLMMSRVLDAVNQSIEFNILHEINIHHNYAAIENHFGKNVVVHRKGATKATKRLEGIIPGSMGTSSYIVKGLGNKESFMSCSHGAGRTMGRKQAKRELNLEFEQSRMKGIVHGLRSESNLDEAPGAYKDIDTVMDNQKDLVEITVRLSPLGTIKG